MDPLSVFVLVLLGGWVAARLVISGRREGPLAKKRYVMHVRHAGRDFSESTWARSRGAAERILHREIRRQIEAAGLDPFDGSTEYRLFDRAVGEPRPENVIVFRPGKVGARRVGQDK